MGEKPKLKASSTGTKAAKQRFDATSQSSRPTSILSAFRMAWKVLLSTHYKQSAQAPQNGKALMDDALSKCKSFAPLMSEARFQQMLQLELKWGLRMYQIQDVITAYKTKSADGTIRVLAKTFTDEAVKWYAANKSALPRSMSASRSLPASLTMSPIKRSAQTPSIGQLSLTQKSLEDSLASTGNSTLGNIEAKLSRSRSKSQTRRLARHRLAAKLAQGIDHLTS